MKTMSMMRIAAASLVAVMMGLGMTGCGHSRNDDEDDDRPTFDQVGETRVYNDRPKIATVAPRANTPAVHSAPARITIRQVQVAQHEQRFDQIGEADVAE